MPPAPPPAPPAKRDGNFLTQQLGPFPLWVWVLGAAGVAFVLHKRASTGTAAAGTGTGVDPSTGLTTVPVPTTLASLGPSRPTDNPGWAAGAFAALTGRGFDPLAAQNAISDYLAGNPLTSVEQGLIDQALGLVGPPPNGAMSTGYQLPTFNPPAGPTAGNPPLAPIGALAPAGPALPAPAPAPVALLTPFTQPADTAPAAPGLGYQGGTTGVGYTGAAGTIAGRYPAAPAGPWGFTTAWGR
jgi:hypothetical protein